MEYSEAVNSLRKVLRGRLLSAGELTRLLDISQSTLSKAVRSAAGEVVMLRKPGQRTPVYGLLRTDLPIAARQTLHRVGADGAVSEVGEVFFLDDGKSHVRCLSPNYRALNGLYEGLPPFVRTMMPSGFVGRELVRGHHRLLRLPASLRDWRDEHHLVFLVSAGHDMPGDLVLGAQAADLALRLGAFESLATDADRGDWYTDNVLSHESRTGGASAGGEQPKFLVSLAGNRHLLVKYAQAASRWADLLACEHLALAELARRGIAAAGTHWFEHRGMCYLEVERFDRVGEAGRLPVVSAGAVDDERFGKRDSWSAFARRCADARLLTAEDQARIERLSAFGVLIGNSDMHFENLSLVPDYARGTYRLAPAYDMLPMRYAPATGASAPELLPLEISTAHADLPMARWAEVKPWALNYWRQVATDIRIGDALRHLASRNHDVIQAHLARVGLLT